MKVTIADVAKKAGVSKTTVSRILNGHLEHATEETRERILAVIRELDYRPNALARGLKQSKTNVLGIVLSNLQNPFWARVLEGVEDACRSMGYSLMICNSNEDPDLEEEYIKGLQMRQVDGIIINPTMKNFALYEALLNYKFPVVAVNRKMSGLEVDMVVMDNIKGSTLAINQLWENGRRNIAIMLYPFEGVSPRIERIEGYKQALRNNGAEIRDNLIQVVPEKKGLIKEATKELIRKSPDIDAIFSTNNMMTLEILEAIKELNLRVPDDIALIGYDETVWSKHLDPPLTTVSQPAFEMGELAAKSLIKKIQSKRSTKPKTTVLEPELIIRRSCGTK
ncbi:substrate-binding domain-containing protein [Brevibacillus agri]|uniref:LacI family DNA-binding transcriptional regulator n=1 Tax=Brevibacillus agri TaxID=51101 RepID=UPI0018CF84AD|nr:substrate-binding domain-containing protein [Brevibacillus agri]MBG9565518.1 transcriptional regulator [Brevibacillus agri]